MQLLGDRAVPCVIERERISGAKGLFRGHQMEQLC